MADDDYVDADNDNKCQRFTGSLDKGYHHTELMVYTRQPTGDIFDSTGFYCKHREEDLTDWEERDLSCGRLESDCSNSWHVDTLQWLMKRSVALQSGEITDLIYCHFHSSIFILLSGLRHKFLFCLRCTVLSLRAVYSFMFSVLLM